MPLLPQLVLHEFMAEGHFSRHIRRMRTIYVERAEIFQEAMSARLAGLLNVPPITAGIDTAAFLPKGMDDQAAAKALLDVGIETRPLSAYRVVAAPPSGLVLGFAPFAREAIVAGVARIAEILEGIANQYERASTLSASCCFRHSPG